MSRILLAICLALSLIAFAGVNAFGPGMSIAIAPNIILFGAIVLGGLLYVVTVFNSERDRENAQTLTRNLENANIKLTQLDTLKSEFLSFASHQIKAPMTVVKGYAQLILDGTYGSVDEQLKGVVGKIKTSSDRMIGLVDTFLNLRRLDEGRLQYHWEPIIINDFVATIIDDMRQLADAKGLHLSLQTPQRAWSISADSQHLRQVVQNLIDNAIKYTDTGTVSVAITEGEHPATVTIRVDDTGRGISRDLAPKLFEQFSRDQNMSREIAGTGLGLYIARRIIEAHHGRIWATSPGPGKGSSFFIELPRL